MMKQRTRIATAAGLILVLAGLAVPGLAEEPPASLDVACAAHAGAMTETAMLQVMSSPGHDTGMPRAHNGAGNMMGAGTP